jgi:hypothetical protein
MHDGTTPTDPGRAESVLEAHAVATVEVSAAVTATVLERRVL